MVWIALMAAIAAILMQHLGLAEELAEVVVKVSKCSKCCTFWLTLATLLYTGSNVVVAVTLSLLMAYLSFWVEFVLVKMQKLYDLLWERINKKK